MESFSKKEYIRLEAPDASAPRGDDRRLRQILEVRGYGSVALPLEILRQLYPLSRSSAGFTATLVHREQDWVVVQLEAGDTRHRHYGLAVDYGSTTIHMELVDLNSGTILAAEKAVNGQVAYGTDILTRITFAKALPENARTLQMATVETLEGLMDSLTEATGVSAKSCPLMILSGNTTMIHFLLGLDPWTVFADPYAPVAEDPGFFPGQTLGMDFAGLVYIVPAASNYVGGDIVSGLLAADINRQDALTLFFDIGTNGELVLGNREWLLAGAGAAGPALEGYISPFGMRAAPGAVDSLRIRGSQLTFTTIGNEKPLGICGSGIIDLMAQMRLNGWIDASGQLIPEASPRIVYLEAEGQYAAVYSLPEESREGKALYFSQQDIRGYLDTKAAAYTMVDCLLEAAGVTPEQLERCILSGAFPAHSDLESAITLGLFPDLPREKYRVIANTSLDGARALLLDRSRLEEARQLAESIYCVQFASIPDFLVRMQAAKFIPHTDRNRFPTIHARLSSGKAD